MENQSKTSKFISRQTAKMMANAKKVQIFLIVCAVLGIVSMIFAASAVSKRANPAATSRPPVSSTSSNNASNGATIAENGLIYAVSSNTLTLVSYNGIPDTIEIPIIVTGYPVRAVAGGVFRNNTTLKSVTMANSVGTIGANAFSGCTSLSNVELVEGLQEIGANAFSGCSQLKSVTLPKTFKTADPSAFADCAEGFTLYVYKGTPGEDYAVTNGYAYEYISEELVG